VLLEKFSFWFLKKGNWKWRKNEWAGEILCWTGQRQIGPRESAKIRSLIGTPLRQRPAYEYNMVPIRKQNPHMGHLGGSYWLPSECISDIMINSSTCRAFLEVDSIYYWRSSNPWPLDTHPTSRCTYLNPRQFCSFDVRCIRWLGDWWHKSYA
jgi:hypothetical protein